VYCFGATRRSKLGIVTPPCGYRHSDDDLYPALSLGFPQAVESRFHRVTGVPDGVAGLGSAPGRQARDRVEELTTSLLIRPRADGLPPVQTLELDELVEE